MSTEAVPYLKMNGLGNDFVVFDARKRALNLTEDVVRWISDPEQGPGCDQLIVMENSPSGADVFMRVYNAEGGMVPSCGNATRCVGALLAQEMGKQDISIETSPGILLAHVMGDIVRVDMGVPLLRWDQIPLSEEFEDTIGIELQIGPIDDPIVHTPSVVNVGNPHAIFWVDNIDDYDLARFGPMLENHPMFPERANITLAQVDSADHITIKVWERGAGLTRACGTAACATVVAGVRRGLTDRKVTITLPGGDLAMEWRASDSHIFMTGAWELEYEKSFPAALFEGAQ